MKIFPSDIDQTLTYLNKEVRQAQTFSKNGHIAERFLGAQMSWDGKCNY